MSDYSSMKIAELKKELKAKGLPVTGNKQELVERLQAAVGSDLLDENDDDDQSEELSDEAMKKAEEELQSQADESEKPPSEKENNSEEKDEAKKVESKESEESNVEDKIKARAERFGGFQSDEAKKVARAARFGIEISSNGTSKMAKVPVDMDVLKKRAERFGAAVSPMMQTAEVSEAIKRRQERFGVVTKDEPKAKKVMVNSGVNSVLLEEKLQARKERFKL